MSYRTVQVFLAEDHGPDVMLVKEGLTAMGRPYQLERSADGERALERLLRYNEGDRPDIIILDLNLPRVSGFSVLTRLRENPALLTVPVLILTSSGEAADREEALRLGASAFLSKPPDLDDFIRVVAGTTGRLLGLDSAASAATVTARYRFRCRAPVVRRPRNRSLSARPLTRRARAAARES